MEAEPAEGLESPVSIWMVVVFPAPLAPRKPKISWGEIWRERRSTAVKEPKDFWR